MTLTRAQILDFRVVRLERGVDPLEDIVPTEIVGGDTRVIDIDGGHLKSIRTSFVQRTNERTRAS